MRPQLMGGAAALLLPLAVLAQGVESGDIQPQPAELMGLAEGQSMLLDVVDSQERLIAVGERGHVIGSLDGKQWVQVPTPVRAMLTAVNFPDADNGWAVGHDATIIRSRDGGRSWVLQNFQPELEKPFLDVLFLSTSHGLAIGAYSLMYVTHDGGNTWSEVDTPIREDEWHFNAITRLNNGVLFIVGEAGTLAMSRDDGVTWESVESPYSSSMFDVAPIGENGVLIAGLRGNMFVADDVDEMNWRKIELDSDNSLIGASPLPNGEVVVVGINGVMYQTTDGGSRAERLKNPVGITLAGVQPVKGALVAVGEAGAQFISTK